MRNYAGHRLAPWLAHVMVSRQETARALLTPGEVMQLPPTDELLLVSGNPPIRAKKLRYYEERVFTQRMVDPPRLGSGPYADRPAPRADYWAGRTCATDARLAGDTEGEEAEPAGGGLEQARHPAHEIEAPSQDEPVTADPLGLGDDEPDAATDKRAMDQAQALGAARTVYAIDAGVPHGQDLQLDF